MAEVRVKNLDSIVSPYLVTAEAAKYLKLSTGTLAFWRTIKHHPLRFVLCGTRIRYLVADLDAFAAGCHVRRKASPNVGRPPGSKNGRAAKKARA